MKMTL